ncbi:Aldo/keto reductase [Mycena sanguinolenta]|nr:Aldo/keto reductase [Mycena sanguinolenta]
MSFWARPPAPPSKLGVYRKLSSLAGVHVLPLQLGAMSIGDKWSSIGMGEMDKESSFKLLDAYFDNGGNFIDTANSYQDESSEMFIGEWAEKRGIRDQLVIATKYTTNFETRNDAVAQKVNYVGNNMKSMHISVEASLNKLRTTYIDILYVHWWDWDCSIEEVMNGLHNLVVQARSYTSYVNGLALAPWRVVGAGKFRTDAEEKRIRAAGETGRIMMNPQWERTEDEKKISKALEKVAAEVGTTSLTAVAIAYVIAKVPYCFPIIGGRKVEHLMENLEALDISLSSEQIAYLESAVPFDHGDGTKVHPLMGTSGHFVKQSNLAPIPHSKD